MEKRRPAQYANYLHGIMIHFHMMNEGKTLDRPKEGRQNQKEYIMDKAARQVLFSEDPDSFREEAFPLVGPGKKGIPPGRTKIDRMLINPAALEAADERYEEREDDVIVARALSREEILKLVHKTRRLGACETDAMYIQNLKAANEVSRQCEKYLPTDD